MTLFMQRCGRSYHEKAMLRLMIHLEENGSPEYCALALFMMIASCTKHDRARLDCQVYGRVGERIFHVQ